MLLGDLRLFCLTTGREFQMGIKPSLPNPRGCLVTRSRGSETHCIVYGRESRRIEAVVLTDCNTVRQFTEMDAFLRADNAPRQLAVRDAGLCDAAVRTPFRGLLREGVDHVIFSQWLSALVEGCIERAVEISMSMRAP